MKLSPEERETIILYDESTDKASVYTHDKKIKEKLKRLHTKYPDMIYPERKEHPGAVSYIVPKKCVMVASDIQNCRISIKTTLRLRKCSWRMTTA